MTSPFVGEFDLTLVLGPTTNARAVHLDHGAKVLHGLLTDTECGDLAAAVPGWVPVGVNGMRAGFDPRTDPIGSWRATARGEPVAAALWERVRPLIEPEFDAAWPSDHDGRRWRATSINPLLRFIRYVDGGLLVPHYDAPYIADDRTRTLLSLVIYLGSAASGGRTRFLHDPQLTTPFAERDHSDWQRLARPDEIRAQVEPRPGDAVVFPHRLLHDCEPVRGGEKLLLRTDVLYSAA